jgi:hypothetical protein
MSRTVRERKQKKQWQNNKTSVHWYRFFFFFCRRLLFEWERAIWSVEHMHLSLSPWGQRTVNQCLCCRAKMLAFILTVASGDRSFVVISHSSSSTLETLGTHTGFIAMR